MTKFNTPNGLGYTLAREGEIPNAMVQVTKMDRKFVGNIFNEFQSICNQFQIRVNMIYFVESTDVFTPNHTGHDGHNITILEQVRSLKIKIHFCLYDECKVKSNTKDKNRTMTAILEI